MNYYNDLEPFAAKWLTELIKDGLTPEGHVDDRSILEIQPDQLDYTQCHFFAGIGGWPRALELAGWDSTRPVWTASLPCQPFSCAGQQGGEQDERHLWPVFYSLVKECRPPIIFGEQVASRDGREWLAGIQTDLETLGYTTAAADLPAASVGAPHKRNRLFWVAQSIGIRQERSIGSELPGVSGREREPISVPNSSPTGRVADSTMLRRQPQQGKESRSVQQKMEGAGEQRQQPCYRGTGESFWSNSLLIPCADGKWRRVPGRVGNTESCKKQRIRESRSINGRSSEDRRSSHWDSRIQHHLEIEPLLFPLADGIPNRVGILRGAGNSIVPAVAAEFIKAVMEIINEKSIKE